MLGFIFLSVALVTTAVSFVCCPGLSPVWVILMPPLVYIGAFIVYILALFVASLCLPMKKELKKTSSFVRFLARITMEWLMSVMRVRVHLKGKELLPKEPMVLVSNHVSDFDPMVVLAVLRRQIAFISKESNFKIPMVGPLIYRAGFLGIDREHAMRAMRTLKKAAERMTAENIDMGIYPEGTRSKTGELLEFKTGAFVLAKRSKAPVVVMSTKGTEKISHNAVLRKTEVELNILRVISPAEVEQMSLEELSACVKGLIAKDLGKTVE